MVLLPVLLVPLALQPDIQAFRVQEFTEIRFRVTDGTGQPVPGAKVGVSIWADIGRGHRNYVTDAEGTVVAPRPKRLMILRVWVSKPGSVSVYRGWESGDHSGGQGVPDEFPLVLQPGGTIGGRVVNDAGEGVPGVKIQGDCVMSTVQQPKGIKFETDLKRTQIGPDGRWQIRDVPPAVAEFYLKFTHPDYVSDTQYRELQTAQKITDEQLRAGTALVRLEAGARVSGRITGPDGQPVPEAVVTFDDRPLHRTGTQIRTQADGTYTLPVLKPGRCALTFTAKNLEPARRELELAVGPRVEDVQLGVGIPLKVRVVDEAGQPVPKAGFRLASWRNEEALTNDTHPNLQSTGIPTQADADGLYTWLHAPADAVTFSIWLQGFRARELGLTADGTVQTVVLSRVPVVTGTITGATTGLPVPRGRIIPIVDFWSSGGTERQDGLDLSSGKYRMELRRDDCDYRVLVEAPGYRTAISRGGLLKDQVDTVDFQLEPAPLWSAKCATRPGNR